MDQKFNKDRLHSSHKIYSRQINDEQQQQQPQQQQQFKDSDFKQFNNVEQSKLNNSINNKQSVNIITLNSNNTYSNPTVPKGRITLVVENTKFIVNTELFAGHLDTLLGRMFGSSNCTSNLIRPNEKGEFNVAEGISANVFKAILVSSHLEIIFYFYYILVL